MTPADLKPAARVRDKAVYERFHAQEHRCLHCKIGRGIQACHLLRGNKREDFLNGLVPLCWICHPLFDEGGVSLIEGAPRTAQAVRASVAAFLRCEDGSEAAAYLIRKLGPFGAEDYVLRLEEA